MRYHIIKIRIWSSFGCFGGTPDRWPAGPQNQPLYVFARGCKYAKMKIQQKNGNGVPIAKRSWTTIHFDPINIIQ